MAENNKSMADAKTDEEKEKIVSFILWFVSSVYAFPLLCVYLADIFT